MPLYEFKCDECEHSEEVIVSIAIMEVFKENPEVCTKCGKGLMQKAVTTSSIDTRGCGTGGKFRSSRKAHDDNN